MNGNPYDVITPYYSYDTGGNTAYFVYARESSGSTSFYQLFKITDPITNPVLTSIQVPATTYVRAPSAQQLGGAAVDNFTRITKAPVLRDGLLYTAHAIRNTQHITYSSLKYFVIDVNTNTIVEEVEQGEDGYFFIQPAITVDKDHNIALTYSKSSSTSYIGAYYSTRMSSDPPGLSPSKVMTEGLSAQSNSTRWGDYFSAAVDPVNQNDIWLFCEFAKNGNWSTWLTEIRIQPYTGAHAYSKSFTVDFGNVEAGSPPVTKSVILSNYGEDDLVIESITSPVGPFTFLTSLSLPYTLALYDSVELEFEFDPSDPILYEELMPFNNNDPDFPGFTLRGRGFEINPAYTDIFYAATGAPDTGKTILLNKNTGVGQELGSSNFPVISSLAINPLTNIMYGTVPGLTESDLVRVNADSGDAYTLYTLDLGFIVGLAFDTSGVLYAGLQNGEIYTVDLTNGTYTQVITANIQLTSIAINPLTNEMWAVPKVVIGAKDKIYKVNLNTGNATLIGETGFDVLTNDITFDEAGMLYGVIGSSTEIGKLVVIDTTTALGTLVGETGFEDVQGLAYTTTGEPLSADGENNVPKEFTLKQNYPNPFNPTTKIDFVLPEKSFVDLKVYNILGKEIKTLVYDEKPAGYYEIEFNAEGLPSGVYLYKIKAGQFSETKKMLLLK